MIAASARERASLLASRVPSPAHLAGLITQRARLFDILNRHVRPEDAKCTDVGLVLAVYGRWLEQSEAHIGDPGDGVALEKESA